jgi:peptidoglycan/LPS O-acetylase OafA/YrhL
VAGGLLCLVTTSTLPVVETLFSWLPHLSSVDNERYWHMIGATLLVGAVLHWPLLQSPFGGAFGRFLGRISFVLYLIHIPVICGFTSWMVISPLAISVESPARTAMIATIALVFVAAAATCKLVDEHPTRFSRRADYALDRAFLGGV